MRKYLAVAFALVTLCWLLVDTVQHGGIKISEAGGNGPVGDAVSMGLLALVFLGVPLLLFLLPVGLVVWLIRRRRQKKDERA